MHHRPVNSQLAVPKHGNRIARRSRGTVLRKIRLTSGPTKVAHALDSTQNMTECSKGSQRLKKFTNRAGGSFLFFQMEEMEKKRTNKNKTSQNPYRAGGSAFYDFFSRPFGSDQSVVSVLISLISDTGTMCPLRY